MPHVTGQSILPSYVPALRATPEHVRWLDRRKSDLDRVLDSYNYSLKTGPWDFQELRSPLIKKTAIFRFESVEPTEGSSAFVAIIPAATAAIGIVPLWERGFRPIDSVDLDPHNIAIFNAMVTRERPILTTDSERFSLAVLYLYLFEESPKILEEETLPTILDEGLVKKSKVLLPTVRVEDNKRFDVRLFEQISANGFVEFFFSFDQGGVLRSLTKENHPKSELIGSH